MTGRARKFLSAVGLSISVALLLAAGLAPSHASAEALCTDSWTGPSEGGWATGEDWSTGSAPSSTEVACIGTGKTVNISEGTHAVGVLQDQGTLNLHTGTLEITNGVEPSSVATATVNEGTIVLAGALDVTGSLSSESLKLVGSGSLVVRPGSTTTIDDESEISHAKLINEGTVSFPSGFIDLTEGAEISNTAIFDDDSDNVGLVAEGSGATPHFVNTGVFQVKVSPEDQISHVAVNFDNKGTVDVSEGRADFSNGGESSGTNRWETGRGWILFTAGSFALNGGEWTGNMIVEGATVTTEGVSAEAAQVSVFRGSFSVAHGSMAVKELAVESYYSTLGGAGTLVVSNTLALDSAKLTGTGSLVALPGTHTTISAGLALQEHTFVNEGTLTFTSGYLELRESARLENTGSFTVSNGEFYEGGFVYAGNFVNYGTLGKTTERSITVDVEFINRGIVEEAPGTFDFFHPLLWEEATLWGELENPSAPEREAPMCAESVSCGGNFSQTQTDLSLGGRGVGLDLTRTYNSQAAAQGTHGPFGFGWSSSFSDHLVLEPESHLATLVQADGSAVPFTGASGEAFTAPAWTQDVLSGSSVAGYTLTLEDQTVYSFNGSGRLRSVTERNGNATSLSYSGGGELERITDPSGRSISFAYNGEGLVESATDPMGHVVKYAYEGGNLISVSQPGESAARWQFKYGEAHQMTEMVDGRGGKTVNKYNGAHQVTEQTDPMGNATSFEYRTFQTSTTNVATGAVSVQYLASNGLSAAVTKGYGTAHATTEYSSYNAADQLLSTTNGDGHTTKYGYDSHGNRTSMVEPGGQETKWTYDGTHDVESETKPDGETTTYKRDVHGNVTAEERPAPGATTQTTKYEYNGYGEPTSMTDPLGHTTKYEYDAYGDRTAEIDPEGNERTWSYNEDSQETGTVSPRGNVGGGDPAAFETSIERDAQGRVVSVTEPEAASAPVNRVRPSISGIAVQGQTLTAQDGVWEGASSLSYSYEWQACNSAGADCFDTGLTGSTLELSSEAVGYSLRVVVTATNADGSSSGVSAATSMVSATVPDVYTETFGSAGSGDGELDHPAGIAVDAHGDVWVADSYNSRIEKFSGSGEWLASYGRFGSGDELEFEDPVGVAVNRSTGNVYVADEADDRVVELNEHGEWVRAWEGGEHALDKPLGITVDSKGDVWVTNAGDGRVEEFSEGGSFMQQLGSHGSGEGQFLLPGGVVVANGYVYVTDVEDARIEAFTEAGEYVGQAGEYGGGAGDFIFPAGIAADSSGDLYVADLGNDRVDKLTPYADFLSAFGTEGDGPGQLDSPEVVAVAPSGEVYVTDTENNRVEAWKPASTPTNTTLPSISGELHVGQTLSAGPGVWAAEPAPSYSYQWQRCNSSDEECADISGASGSTYTLTSTDLGKTLRLLATAKNSEGEATSTSPNTEAIAGPRTTTYSYDADGNKQSMVEPDGAETKYTYDADNELTKTQYPNGDATETEYDGAGQVVKQTDGNGHSTGYKRNVLEQVEEETDPLSRKTTKEYDDAGNLVAVTDAEKRTTHYKYDADGRLTEITYSDGTTPTVKYEYNGDGKRTKMVDGTGTTTYEYDQLDRLTSTTDGHGDTVDYEYNLGNDQTKITYPNGKSVSREYDEDGDLAKVTDWDGNVTKFEYDPDSDVTKTVFPGGTGEEDVYSYDDTDAMSEVEMRKGSEVLASVAYTRGSSGMVERASSTGLPGEERAVYAYDEDRRLTSGSGVKYKYDAGNNPVSIHGDTLSYDAADEVEKASKEGSTVTTYSYNEVGQRSKTTPASGPATTYEYNQAGDLTKITRPEEGATPAIEDIYSYNGDGLRVSVTRTGSTKYATWDVVEPVPLILDDGTNSYLYGPAGLPFEQISSTGTIIYLHHDQQGSTRMLTSSAGGIDATVSYDVYGNETERTGTASSPFGYGGQYTDAGTGLLYLRARYYDPASTQFISKDPAAEYTRAPYTYTYDDPLNASDPSGERPQYSCETAPVSRARQKCESTAERIVNSCLVTFSGRIRTCQQVYESAEREYGTDNRYVRKLYNVISEVRSRVKEWANALGGPVLKLAGPAISEIVQYAKQAGEVAREVFTDLIDSDA